MFESDHSHNEAYHYSLETLWHRLMSVPIFVALLPLIAGIILADSFAIPIYAALAALAIAVIGAWLTLGRDIAWCYGFVAVMLFGYVTTQLQHPSHNIPYRQSCDMLVSVESHPVERSGYRSAEGRIEAWWDGTIWHSEGCRAQLWIRSEEVCVGDKLHIFAHLEPRMSKHRSYNDLLLRRSLVGGVAIGDDNIISLRHHAPSTLQQRAIAKLAHFTRDSSAHSIVEAMTTGSRRLVEPSLREAYSRTGLAHLLAVSGLHLGCIMLVVLFVTRPLLLIHRGHRLRNIVVIVVLWLFVAMSGASPSAVRAALMLTIVQLALFGSARRNTVNTIAIALALMLIYRPDYLYDISFQLSAAAVIGIVVWGIPLIGHLGHLNPIYRGVVTTVVIGITATLWTLPLISHAFGNIPLIGIVVTPLAMLTAYAVIIFGFATLLLPVAIATPFAMAAEWAAGVQNDIVLRAAEEWWGAVPFTLSEGGVVACYVALLTITLVIWSRKRKKVVSLWEYDDYIRH